MWAAPKLETRGTRTYAHRAQPWPEGALPADTAPMDSAKKTASDDRTFRGSNPSGSPAHPSPHRRATQTSVPIKSLAGQWMRGYPTDRAQPSPRPPRRRLGGACHAQALMHAVTSHISPLPCVSFPRCVRPKPQPHRQHPSHAPLPCISACCSLSSPQVRPSLSPRRQA
jgi:hypothetical protein